MDGDRADQDVEQLLVQGRQPIAQLRGDIAEQRPGLHDLVVCEKARDRLREQQCEQREDHQAAERIVTCRRRRTSRPERAADIREDRRGATDECRKARVARADESPDHARGREQQHGVATPGMHSEPVALQLPRQPGTQHGEHQPPVDDTDRQIPHPAVLQRVRVVHGAGCTR